jgi:RimJ/RimL family protein N-acetyltransferase
MTIRWKDNRIHSARLVLAPFAAEDADEAFSCITPTLTRYMTWEPPASRAEFDGIWRDWILHAASGIETVFAIRTVDDGNFAGLAGLHRASTPCPELGIWIREDRHGRGYGREAVQAVAWWASARLHPRCFIYPVAEANLASRKIAESLGGVMVASDPTEKYQRLTYEIPPLSGIPC